MRQRRGTRGFAGRALLRSLALGLAVVPCVLALGARADAEETSEVTYYVKYHVVRASDDGKPERLSDIAARLLGAGSRSAEIFELNADRVQPDGGRLTDPDNLHEGWVLILPWDAAGEGVVHGVLPDRDPAGTEPDPPEKAGACTVAPHGELGAPPWPRLRLAPDQAWPISKGAGVTVALIGSRSPVDSPALAGRMRRAVTVGSAEEAGTAECPGRETAMAGIIAAKPISGGKLAGVAPKATILPVVTRIASGAVKPADLADAVTAAVTEGADVVAVPVPVDLADKTVRAAVDRAVGHGAVVLVPAGTSGTPAPRVPGVLRVAAIGADDKLLADYVPGGADVLAPGRHVASLAANGVDVADRSGTDVAVAYVAGLAALVSAAAPELSASAVARAIESTADRPASDEDRSIGVINPAAAVKATATNTDTSGTGGPDNGNAYGSALIVALLAVLSLTALLRLRSPTGWLSRRRERTEEQ